MRGSWAVGRGHGSWVSVNVEGKKKNFHKNKIKIEKLNTKKL